jgi:hypothetical protein
MISSGLYWRQLCWFDNLLQAIINRFCLDAMLPSTSTPGPTPFDDEEVIGTSQVDEQELGLDFPHPGSASLSEHPFDTKHESSLEPHLVCPWSFIVVSLF